MTERIQIVDLFSHDGKIENHITKTTRMTLSQGPTALFKSVKPLFEFVPNCAHSQMSATEKCLITFIKIDALWFLYVTSFCLFSVQFFFMPLSSQRRAYGWQIILVIWSPHKQLEMSPGLLKKKPHNFMPTNNWSWRWSATPCKTAAFGRHKKSWKICPQATWQPCGS